MRAVRIECGLEELQSDSRIGLALEMLSWDYRGCLDMDGGDLLVMCECISSGAPLPPQGFSIEGVTLERILEQWHDSMFKHHLVVLRFDANLIARYFSGADLSLISGTNLTSRGLVLQITGKSESIMRLVTDIRERVPVRSITTVQGGKGLIASGPDIDQQRVLREAFIRGWYDEPKGTSVRKLSTALGISKSSVANHLIRAERKVIGNYLDTQ